MLIMTVTLNPAVDKTIEIDDFTVNQVNRVKTMRMDAGGKGINVSSTIKALGRKSQALAVLGGRAGSYIESVMDKQGIALVALKIDGETRTNLKIVDVANQTHTDINEKGPQVCQDFEKEIADHMQDVLKKGDTLVLSGSILPGLTNNLYKELISMASAMGVFVILDAEGEQLSEALKAGPDIIKPNIHELSAYVGQSNLTQEQVIEVAKSLIDGGKVKRGILVSLGEEGALWIGKNEVLKVQPQKADVKSTVGAGDAMVAALAIGLEEKMDISEMLKLATACALERITTDGPIVGDSHKIESLAKKVIVHSL